MCHLLLQITPTYIFGNFGDPKNSYRLYKFLYRFFSDMDERGM